MPKKASNKPSEPTGYKLVSRNRKAFHDFAVLEKFEAGIVLVGTEVKSLRTGKASIAEAFGRVRNEAIWLVNCDIPAYANKGYSEHDPRRPRKLLLHGREVANISKALEEKGRTLVPLSLYFNDRGIAKVEIGLATGKGKSDKREDIKKRDHKREIDREMSRKR
jgi:SsrA-binding protein